MQQPKLAKDKVVQPDKQDDETYWNKEAARVIAQAGYRRTAMHVVYIHPNGGGKIFLGDSTAAQDVNLLDDNEVYRIVNTTKDLPMYMERDLRFDCKRFVITGLYGKTSKEIGEYTAPILQFIEDSISKGKNVLVHCLAGAHRSAVLCSAYLYNRVKQDSEWALRVITERRPIAQPSLYSTFFVQIVQWTDMEKERKAKEREVPVVAQQHIVDSGEKKEEEKSKEEEKPTEKKKEGTKKVEEKS